MQRRQFLGTGSLVLAGASGSPAAWAQAIRSDPYGWQSMRFGGGAYVSGILTHPKVAGLVYARADRGGLYRRNAATGSWVPLLDEMGGPRADWIHVYSMAVDPKDPQRVYAACGAGTGEWSKNAALLVSSDQGANWTIHEQTFHLGGAEGGRGSGERLQLDPADGRSLLLGTSKNGLLKSGDGGVTFKPLNLPARHVSLVVFDPTSAGRVLYVGAVDKPGLYVSRDGGASIEREVGAPAEVPQRAAFAPDGSLFVSFAVGGEWPSNPGGLRGGSVWKRTPAGGWRDVTPHKPVGRPFAYGALDVDARGHVVTSMMLENWDGRGDEIYLSADGGSRWTALSTRSEHDKRSHPWLAQHLAGVQAMGHQISSAAFDPAVPGRISYGNQHGVWTTDDVGVALGSNGSVQWRFDVQGIEQAPAVYLHSPSGGVQLFAAMGSNLGGAAWESQDKAPDAGLFKPCRDSHRSVDSAWLVPRIVARTAEAGTGGAVSVDGGATWRPFGEQALVKEARGGHVAVSAKGGFIVWAPPQKPALVSRDLGRSWALCTGWPAVPDAEFVPVAEKNAEGIFYVLDITQGTLLVSTDGGQSFGPNVTGLPKFKSNWQRGTVVSAPGKLRDVWIGLPDRLLHFPGADASLRTIAKNYGVQQLALGMAAPGAAYHGVYVYGTMQEGSSGVEGLYRSDDMGESFVALLDAQHRFGKVHAMAADPLEHGVVYLGTEGRGVLMGRPDGKRR